MTDDPIDLPPASRIPVNTGGMRYFPIESYYVGSWGPLPDGKGESTQVHLRIYIKGREDIPLVMRFKTADALDRFIAALQRHRADVWPHGGRR